jgi:hypothetical protein
MIIIYESNTLKERYPTEVFGICTQQNDGSTDSEEWLGIRSQLIAQVMGWA